LSMKNNSSKIKNHQREESNYILKLKIL